MRLILGEHYPPRIAEQLRRRGYDVVAAVERPDLRGHEDEALFVWARHEGRALVTEDVGHFTRLHYATVARGQYHHGLLFTSPRRFPRNSAGIGRLVDALAAFLDVHAAEETIESSVTWL